MPSSADLIIPFSAFNSTTTLTTAIQSTLELTHSDSADYNTYSLLDSNGDPDLRDDFFSYVHVKFNNNAPMDFKISSVDDFLNLYLDFVNLSILENDNGSSVAGAYLYVDGAANSNTLAITLARLSMIEYTGATDTATKLEVSKITPDITTNLGDFISDTNTALNTLKAATKQTITSVLNDGVSFNKNSAGVLGQIGTSLNDIFLYLLAIDSNFMTDIETADGDWFTYSASSESPTLSISYILTITHGYRGADDSSDQTRSETFGVKIKILEPN